MKPMSKAFFVSEQRKPFHGSTVNLLLRRYSKAAPLPLLAHLHMLRRACGFALADQGGCKSPNEPMVVMTMRLLTATRFRSGNPG
jgi:hypothetical protein